MWSYLKKKRINKQKKNLAIAIMIDFVEGRMSTVDFWNILNKDEIMRKILRSNKRLNSYKLYFDENNLEKINISRLSVRVGIYWKIKQFLKIEKYKVNPNNIEEEKFMFLSDIQPEWLYIRDEDFLSKIINSAPSDLTKEKNIQWCRSKIKELFKFDKKPPEWVQEPEWPIVNGEPLVFKNQTEDGSKITYYFYSSKTHEEVEVIQYE